MQPTHRGTWRCGLRRTKKEVQSAAIVPDFAPRGSFVPTKPSRRFRSSFIAPMVQFRNGKSNVPRSRVKLLVSIVLFAGLLGGSIWAVRTYRPEPRKAANNAGGEKIPASVATANQQDFPVFLDSLGNVQAWNTVTVRTRVDGEIQKIAFDEGQFVKQGDLLAEIDPRPLSGSSRSSAREKDLGRSHIGERAPGP